MDAIFKNENVYVVVRNKEIRNDVNLDNNEHLILCTQRYYKSHNKYSLYGGRVYLEVATYDINGYIHYCDYCYMTVDGCVIKLLTPNEMFNGVKLEQVAAYLNQIENLGVDSFLENYKLQLQELKKELENNIKELQQELTIENNEEKAKTLEELKKLVLAITCSIFFLLVNMNAGLDNHSYTDAYNTIINLYF